MHTVLEKQGVCISASQSAKLKGYSQKGELTSEVVEAILAEKKAKGRKITIKKDAVSKYFSEDYSDEDIERIILELLEDWKERRAADGISD